MHNYILVVHSVEEGNFVLEIEHLLPGNVQVHLPVRLDKSSLSNTKG